MKKLLIILALALCQNTISFLSAENHFNSLSIAETNTAFVCDDKALNFDGVDDYVEINGFVVPTSGDFTVEFWVNSSSVSTYKEFISQGGGNAFYIGTYSGSTEIRCGDVWQSTGVYLPLNQWVHVAMTKSGSGATLYLNGLPAATTYSYSISAGGTFTRLGRQYDGHAEYPNASLDEVRIWNVARSPEQIFDNMNYELSAQAGLVGSYHFNEGIPGNDNSAINQILDDSGNDYHGTLIGFAKTGTASNWVEGSSSAWIWYEDGDNDGYGNPDETATGCTIPTGYVGNSADCNDDDDTIHPDAEELCDGVDANCDGLLEGELPSGVKLYLPFSEDANDESGLSHHGTVFNAALTTDRLETSGSAYSFNGSNARIEVPDHPDLHPVSFTLSTWIYYASVPGNLQHLVAKPICGGWSDSYAMWFNSGQLFFGWGDGPSSMQYYSFPPPAAGQWHHLVLTFDDAANQARIYIDNVLNGTYVTTLTIAYDNTPFIIGAEYEYCGLDFWLNGKIDETALFNRALNTSEITTLYQMAYVQTMYYEDVDMDGYGNPSSFQYGCTGAPTGFVANDMDCDDNNNLINPGSSENCNGIDDNCNLIVDEDFALHFDGSNDYISLPVIDYSAFNTMTIEAWIKPQDITSNAYYEISRQDPSGLPDWLFSFQDHGTIISFGLRTTDGYSELDVPIVATDFVDGEWHHVAAVYDGANRSIYKDGVLIGTDVKSGNIIFSSTAGNHLGHYPLGGEYFFGVMDEVYFWNIARTQNEILEDMTISPGPQSGLVASYSLDNGIAGGNNASITQVLDASGNGYHGTVVNFSKSGPTSNWVSGINTPTIWYEDADMDGYGNPDVSESSCSGEEFPGYVENNDDCDDDNNMVNPNGGELCNGVDDDCDGETDEAGNALHFDGVNDNIFLPTAGYQTTSSYTIECWLNTTSPEFIMIWESQNPMYSNPSLEGMSDNLEFWIDNSSMVSTGPISTGQWNHIACVYNSATQLQSIYVNGDLKQSATVSTVTDLGSTLYLGSRQGTNTFYGGLMDELRIWTVARTQAEIAANMSLPIDPAFEPSLAAYYRFDQGTSDGDNSGFTHTHDYSGNNHDGLLNNFAMAGTASNYVSPTPMPGATTYYADSDNDGFGNLEMPLVSCTGVPSGYVLDDSDCNDASALAYPGGTEICNGIDDDCDGITDEGFINVEEGLHFDGGNDFINVGNWWNNQQFTVQMWIKPGSSQVSYANIIDNNHSGGIRWVSQQMCGTNCFEFGLTTDSGPAVINFNLTANVWQHLTLVKSATSIAVYINGVSVGTAACSGNIIGSGIGQDNIFIGNWNGNNRFFNGSMDEIRLWNYALTGSQIQEDMYCELTGSETGLVTYYKLNQGVAGGNNTSITTATDASGNGHHGSLIGFNLTGSTSNFVTGADNLGNCGVMYADSDGDGYGNPAVTIEASCGVPGYVINNDDCDDDMSAVHPNATELCNGMDDDCDNQIDEDVSLTFYADADNDGYGNPSVTTLGCTAPSGFISDNTDCNDAAPSIHPGATEECNGLDDNCDGVVDEGFVYSGAAVSVSSSNGNTFCAGGSTMLTLSGGTLGTGAEWVWYEGGCGNGTSIGIGTSIEVNPSGGVHTYFVRAEGTCNSTSCTAILITVNYAPAFTTCPADFSMGNDPETCDATSNYSVVASGSPAPTLSYALSDATSDSGSGTGSGTVLNLGTTLITITADNLCGSAECSFDITVNDIEDPIISGCPLTITSEVDAGQWGAIVAWTEPNAIDNCAMGMFTSSHYPGGFFNVGSTVVTYTATDESGNSSTCTFMVTVEPPEILGDNNLSIFANDIQFSNSNPIPGSFINVSASVHNTSEEDASSFVCHLVDQYSNTSYPDVIVPALLANQSTIVSWVIETPAVPAFVPMQVTIDFLDSQDESNELDNQAIRPFINGDFDFGGQIVVVSNPVPSSTVAGNYISICGNAYYDDTAIPLEDSSVAGAQVTVVITETGQILNGVTNTAGDFCLSYHTPYTAGTYHYSASVTDFTLTGDTSGTFMLTPPPVEYCPLDLSLGVELFGPFLCGNIYHIVQGSSLTGVLHVSNSCQSVSEETTLYIALPDGTPVPGPFVIPTLAPGQTYDVALPAMTFNTVGSTYISATVDYLNEVAEDVESNNTRNITLHVHPALPDITPVYGQVYPHFQCSPGIITFRIDNQGGVPTGSFVALLDIYQEATLETSLTQTVSSIDGLCYTYISFPFSPAAAGLYQFNLYCDTMPDGVTELSETNNNLTFFHYYQPCNLDLTVHGCGSLDVKPTDPVSPGNITLYASISNYGQLPVTTPFVVNFDVEGTIYPVAVNSTLAPNTSYNVSVTVPTPPHGDNDLIVTVDGDNDVVELYETNNSQSAKLCWDFEVVNSRCSGGQAFRPTQFICNPMDLAIGVYNLGSYEASNLQVKFEVSGPGLEGWIDLGYATTFADITCNCPHHVTLPSSFYFPGTGSYLVRITADFDGLYTECAEDNNQLILPVNVLENPDYAVYSQYIAPSDLNPDLNEVVTFNLSYINEGCTGVSDIELFMDVDNTAHDSMPAMAVPTGAVNTYPMTQSWSSALPGLHVIRSVIDHDNGIVEGNEMNNEATRAVLVGSAPNFNLFALVSSDLSPLSGENITLIASVANEGESGADGVLQFYFVDAQGDEVLIGQEDIHLSGGETIVQPVVWIVTHPYARVISRVINVDPLEYDYSDNEQELQLNSLSVSISTTHVDCSGFDLGEMEALITGGQAPYYIQWSNGQSGDSIMVPAGTYSAMVTDVNGLTAMAEDTVHDQALPTTWYLDADNDAFGDPTISVYDCVQPEDYVGTATDCDDTNGNAFPGATELPDGVDNDCDGLVDEGLNSLSIDAGDCETVYLGYAPSSCQSLSVSVSGGTIPYTYQWSNGATTATISVCPEETTIYTIVVTDQNGFTAQDVVTVQVIDIRCGNNNDKVLVCHLPPGNPENVQMICISENAVAAHLAEHGDYLGICEAADPCQIEGESYGAAVTHTQVSHEIQVLKPEVQHDALDLKSPFSLSPNPADTYIDLQFSDPLAACEVGLFDVSGKLIHSIKHAGGDLQLTTADLANGIYFVRIRTNGKRMTKGLVILH